MLMIMKPETIPNPVSTSDEGFFRHTAFFFFAFSSSKCIIIVQQKWHAIVRFLFEQYS